MKAKTVIIVLVVLVLVIVGAFLLLKPKIAGDSNQTPAEQAAINSAAQDETISDADATAAADVDVGELYDEEVS